jgi:hypothetical protein
MAIFYYYGDPKPKFLKKVRARSQPWTATGERSGLLTRTAMMESVSTCARMKSLGAFETRNF